jgi:hypothetical protein
MTLDALNAVCPYYTMYPLSFPLGILERHGKRGEWVLDPFCGRGTTNFAARLQGQPSFGIDSSPVAAALALAKTVYVSPRAVVECARSILEEEHEPNDIPNTRFWQLAYRERTRVQLCQLRDALLERCDTASRILLRAIVMGALHGPVMKGEPSYFSNQCPRTFAPKPAYSVRYWKEHDMRPPHVDVLALIERRADRYLEDRLPSVDARIALGDSRDANCYVAAPKFRWIITSPPYFGMRTYLSDQWLRYWFLGGPADVEYGQPSGEVDHRSPEAFTNALTAVWKNAAKAAHPSARMIVRFGGIHDRKADPRELIDSSLTAGGWRIVTSRAAGTAETGRRQVHSFQKAPKAAIAEYDVYARLAS